MHQYFSITVSLDVLNKQESFVGGPDFKELMNLLITQLSMAYSNILNFLRPFLPKCLYPMFSTKILQIS